MAVMAVVAEYLMDCLEDQVRLGLELELELELELTLADYRHLKNHDYLTLVQDNMNLVFLN